MKTIAIMGLKGGVGKTTAAINIASEMTADGQRVLLIEVSKQGNIGKFFGAKGKTSMVNVLNGESITKAIEHTNNDRLDIVASDMGILNVKPSPEALKRELHQVEDAYHFCIIDCEPTFDQTIITAIVAADKIYTPIRMDQYSVDAAIELFDQIYQVDEDKIGGAFVNAIGNSKADQASLLKIKKQIEIMAAMIHKSPKVERMSWQRQPINVLSPRSKAAKEYADLAAEIKADL